MKPLYIHNDSIHNLSAPREVVPLIMRLVKPESVLDVGCGTGTWLKIFEEHGVKDYAGIDGDYVDLSKLVVSEKKFIPQDLRTEWSINRKFDLVLSLEVAEHLPENCAGQFVKSLINHGDIIIFSAAIPGQSGQNHLNEQWPEYWMEKFGQYGFHFFDVIRPKIWGNKNVEWWYKQNIFLIKKAVPERLPFNSLSIVHPELFSLQKKNEKEFFQSLSEGKQGLKLALKIFINALFFKLRSLLNIKKR